MKIIAFSAFIVCLLLSLQLMAQPRFNIQQQLKNLKTELELSDSQVIVIEKILVSQKNKISETMNSFDGDRSEVRSEMMKIRTQTEKNIKAVLNDEQIEKYDKYLNENKKRGMRNRRSNF